MKNKLDYPAKGAFIGVVHSNVSLEISPGWTASDRVIGTKAFLNDKFLMSLELKEFLSLLYYLNHVQYVNNCIILPEHSTIAKYHANLRVSKVSPEYPSWVPIYYSIHRWNYIAHKRTFNVAKMKYNKERPRVPFNTSLETPLQYIHKQYQDQFLLSLFTSILNIDHEEFEGEYKKWNCTFNNIPKWDIYSLIRR